MELKLLIHGRGMEWIEWTAYKGPEKLHEKLESQFEDYKKSESKANEGEK